MHFGLKVFAHEDIRIKHQRCFQHNTLLYNQLYEAIVLCHPDSISVGLTYNTVRKYALYIIIFLSLLPFIGSHDKGSNALF